jgi:hypothetical protein
MARELEKPDDILPALGEVPGTCSDGFGRFSMGFRASVIGFLLASAMTLSWLVAFGAYLFKV